MKPGPNLESIRARVMESATYYAALDVPPNAGVGAIKVAHRGLARLFHPDLSPGAGNTQIMAEVNVAYGVLADPVARRKYDALHKTAEVVCGVCKGTGKTQRQRGFSKRAAVTCAGCGGSGLC